MPPRRRSGTFTDDDRAIEGLPIRLVIALVVGVAALTIMMNMLAGLGDIGQTDVYVEYDDANDEVVFHEVEVVRTAPDGVWVTGPPDEIRLITVGQGFVSAGQSVRPRPAEDREEP